ncbi:MAG TPA: ATP-binding protein [Thermoanaerobaculia bacterium]|nr:ATP-binding protein [Thermoanaerobaculia bacterium]
MAHRFALTVEGDLAALGRAQRALERWVEAAELAPRPAYRAQLVFEEIATNVLKYGWGEGEGPRAVAVEIELEPEALRMAFRDRGRPFDPTAEPEPERPASIADATAGGLGLGLVRKAAAELAYRREGGENVTELRIPLAGA